MKIDILTLFPEMFAPLEHSIVGKAREKGLLEIHYHNFRENAEKSRHVDDEPYGGGQGMLLRAQPIFDAYDAIEKNQPRVVLLDPAGRTFNQAYAEELSQEEELIFICGHYEGYDERIKSLVTDEVSLGDYVLTGGELAAMTMIDATVRLIPEVLGKEVSHTDDSFSSPVIGATADSDGVVDGATVGEITGVDSSANAAPPEVAIANPTIVAEANV